MQLSPEDTLEFNQQVAQIEEVKEMQYVTSVERIGIVKGLFQGREEGKEEGRQEGKEEGKLEVAFKLRDKFGFTVDKIAEALEMPIDKIHHLFNQPKS